MQNNAHKKLITQLSPAVYKLQVASREFRLTAAENYCVRVHIRILRTIKGSRCNGSGLRTYENIGDGVLYLLIDGFYGKRTCFTLYRANKQISQR